MHPRGGLEGHDDASREGLASFPDELHEKLAHHFREGQEAERAGLSII